MVLFFLALRGFLCVYFYFILYMVVLFQVFLKRPSVWFYCCRHIVGLLSLVIVSLVGFPWDLRLPWVLFLVVLLLSALVWLLPLF